MADRKRRIQRYRAWMTGSNAVEVRKQTAHECHSVLVSRHFDNVTFTDLIAVLNHEFLCVKLGQDEINLSPALECHFLDSLLQTLTESLVRSLCETSYLERELQLRALIATFTLLHAKGVHSFESDFYESLQRQLQARFRDLRWHPGTSGCFNAAKFFKIQCSYLLSAAAEYFARIRQAQPILVLVTSRIINLLSFGISAASPAFGGVVPGNLQEALNHLNNGLRGVSSSSNERWSGLFTLQELTMLAVALQSYHDVLTDTPPLSGLAQEVLDRSECLTLSVLKNVISAFAENPNYESNVSPPPEFWVNFQAATQRGPPRLNLYYYLYGLVDCASQVCKASNSSIRPSDLTNKMRQVVLSKGDPGHRWKALEYSLVAGTSPKDVSKSLLEACDPTMKPQLYVEIASLSAAVLENFASYPLAIPGSRVKFEEGEDSAHPQRILSSRDWNEPNFNIPEINDSCLHHKINPKMTKRKPFIAVGMSPSIRAAFVLDKNSAYVYSLTDPRREWKGLLLTKQKRIQEDLKQAVLSDKYIATMSREELQVTSYRPDHADENAPTVVERFNNHNCRSRWVPRCLAIHDAVERSWIVVGGEAIIDGKSGGCIRVFEVINADKGISINKCAVFFNRPNPDPLKGDLIKTIAFSPNGGRLVCVTVKNRVLTWFLSNNLQPRNAPFEIARRYATEPDVRGLTSATLFHSPISRPYILCTTWPSSERYNNGGEWSFVSPVASQPSQIPSTLFHDLVDLGRASPMISGAASPDGRCIALLGRKGEVMVFPLMTAGSSGGIISQGKVKLKQERDKLAPQDEVSPSAMRFRESSDGLELFVVDKYGTILYKLFEGYRGAFNMDSARPSLVSAFSFEAEDN